MNLACSVASEFMSQSRLQPAFDLHPAFFSSSFDLQGWLYMDLDFDSLQNNFGLDFESLQINFDHPAFFSSSSDFQGRVGFVLDNESL